MLSKFTSFGGRVFHKLASVKVLAFGVATWLLWYGKIDQMAWLMIAGAVIGGNVVQKFVGARTALNLAEAPAKEK